MIEIEHEDRQSFAAAAQMRQPLLHFLAQHGAIGEAGQPVMAGQIDDPRFGAFLRGDVLVKRDPSSVVRRLVGDMMR